MAFRGLFCSITELDSNALQSVDCSVEEQIILTNTPQTTCHASRLVPTKVHILRLLQDRQPVVRGMAKRQTGGNLKSSHFRKGNPKHEDKSAGGQLDRINTARNSSDAYRRNLAEA
jgi:hypothetical protein